MTSRYSLLLGLLFAATAWAAEPDAPTLPAPELAARLHAVGEGNSYVRLRMETSGASAGTQQIQIKARRSGSSTELVYQVLWPKERKGESVLLRKNGGSPATGTLFTPPNATRSLDAAQMSGAFFGSSLSYEDLVDDFFAWPQQAIVGKETVDRVPCQILESKPGKGDHSSYSSVRTWVDLRRMVPLRIEKYSGPGKLARRIDTTRVANDDKGHPIPANLAVLGPDGLSTQLDGSKIRHGLEFADAEFTPEGIKQTAIPHGSPE